MFQKVQLNSNSLNSHNDLSQVVCTDDSILNAAKSMKYVMKQAIIYVSDTRQRCYSDLSRLTGVEYMTCEDTYLVYPQDCRQQIYLTCRSWMAKWSVSMIWSSLSCFEWSSLDNTWCIHCRFHTTCNTYWKDGRKTDSSDNHCQEYVTQKDMESGVVGSKCAKQEYYC